MDKSDKKPFKVFGKSAYLVNSSAAAIQAEIYANGPVEASFTVYHDFVPYALLVATPLPQDLAASAEA
jgi:hypothetical protein